MIQQGSEGLQARDDHSVISILNILAGRETNAPSVDTIDIPMVSIAPPIIHETTPAPIIRSGSGPVRLTFDDGPGAHTEQILNILKRCGVHATFYTIGRYAQNYPQTMQHIRSEGHSIGNHSFTHSDLSRLSKDAVYQELTKTQDAIQAASGVTPSAFRPPYGAVNSTVRSVAASLGLSVNLWSVDPRDWSQPGVNVITQRVLGADGPGAVILLHVTHQQTVDALPAIIEGSKHKDIRFNQN